MTIERNLASFLQMLLLLFIGLKLADIIQWSWWWVLAPGWIPLLAAALIVAAGTVLQLID